MFDISINGINIIRLLRCNTNFNQKMGNLLRRNTVEVFLILHCKPMNKLFGMHQLKKKR